MKAGTRTTEFFALIAYGVICILAGLEINDGVVSYHANMKMLDSLLYAVLGYGGYRTAVKVADTVKKPPANGAAKEIAQSILNNLKDKPL